MKRNSGTLVLYPHCNKLHLPNPILRYYYIQNDFQYIHIYNNTLDAILLRTENEIVVVVFFCCCCYCCCCQSSFRSPFFFFRQKTGGMAKHIVYHIQPELNATNVLEIKQAGQESLEIETESLSFRFDFDLLMYLMSMGGVGKWDAGEGRGGLFRRDALNKLRITFDYQFQAVVYFKPYYFQFRT